MGRRTLLLIGSTQVAALGTALVWIQLVAAQAQGGGGSLWFGLLRDQTPSVLDSLNPLRAGG